MLVKPVAESLIVTDIILEINLDCLSQLYSGLKRVDSVDMYEYTHFYILTKVNAYSSTNKTCCLFQTGDF